MNISKMYLRLWCIFGVVISVQVCESYNIMAIFPFPTRSHQSLGVSLVNELLDAGHKVTYITPVQIKDLHPNLTQVIMEAYPYKGVNLTEFLEKGIDKRGYTDIWSDLLNMTQKVLYDENIQRFMEDPNQQYDVVITEWMYNDIYSGFSALFNCPHIWFMSFEHDYETSRLIHDAPSPVLCTNIRTNNIPPLGFLQRVEELVFYVKYRVRKTLFSRLEAELYEKSFGPMLAKRGRTLPPYEIIRYNASLLLSNTHSNLRVRLSLPLSYKPIGGFHISPNVEPLSEDLLRVVESSENGVIIFSTGSYLKADDMPRAFKRDLLSMFASLKYTVLWKIEETFENAPANVKTLPWLPIKSILAHPKCNLFITHGGLLSLTESVHYGVPIIGMPVFADQKVNVKNVVNKGVAKLVPLSLTMIPELLDAINEILSNPGYKERSKKLSFIFQDRPVPPRKELLHWVEHVVATRGAPHLRSPALQLPWYQKWDLEILAVIMIALVISTLAVKALYAYAMKWLSKCRLVNVGLSKIKKSV